MQEHDQIDPYFLIADYQVLGDKLWETELIRESVIDMVIDWMAVGLDPAKSCFVVQSYVPEFAELFNFLTMFVPYTVATNNPTLKDEIKKIEQKEWKGWEWISLGFVNYPVSQVADIMLPLAEIVPVWEDQIPHIELARKIIKKVNRMCGTKYPLPKVLLSDTPRLTWIDGNEKMSKSLWNTIYLTSSLKEIQSQVQKMYTDPGKVSISDKGNIEKHVVFQYLDIFYTDTAHIAELKERYIAGGENSVWDGELKKLLIQVLDEYIAPIREKREYYLQHPEIVEKAILDGTGRMRSEWQKMLQELKEAMGIASYEKNI